MIRKLIFKNFISLVK